MQSKKTIILMVFIAIVVSGSLGQWITMKMIDRLKDKDNQIRDEQQELVAIEELKNSNRGYVDKWESISEFKDEPIGERRTKFTSYLQGLGSSQGITFEVLSEPTEQPMKEASKYQTLSYNLTFSSDLYSLSEFLSQLDNSERLLRIEKLDITKKKSSIYSIEPDLTINLTVSIPAVKTNTETKVGEILP
ncbi:MAG: hypothetical protein JEZ07_11530 [Phycisphaerae bacterium]|nr:hypothetical protein [Phycisphaerae bacterium]